MKTSRTLLLIILTCLTALSAQAQNLDADLKRLRSDLAIERKAALREIAKVAADVRAIEPLMHALHDPSLDVRCEALKTWGLVGNAYEKAMLDDCRWRSRFSEAQNQAKLTVVETWELQLIRNLEAYAEAGPETLRREAVRTLARYTNSVEVHTLPPNSFECGTGSEFYLDYKADEALARIATKSPALMLSLLNEEEPHVTYALIIRLARKEDDAIYPYLKRFLKRLLPVWRMIACAGLAQRSDANRYLLPMLSDPDEKVRLCAIYLLKEPNRVLTRLLPSFFQSAALLRWSLLKLIEYQHNADYSALLQQACDDPDGNVLTEVLQVAKEQKVELSEWYVRKSLQHPYPRVRCNAAEYLMYRQKSPETVSLLLPLLEDQDETVRKTLIDLLWEEKDVRVPAALIAAFRRNTEEENTRVSYALGKAGNIQLPLLQSLFKDRDWRIRAMAANALRYREDGQWMKWLTEASDDSHPKVRAAVAYTLTYVRETNEEETTKIAIKLLNDKDRNVRLQAIKALDGTTDEAVRTMLLHLSQSNDAEIADEAQEALAEPTYGRK